MIFQEPMTSLNPVLTIGEQIAEGVQRARQRVGRAQAREPRARAARAGAAFRDPQRRLAALSAPAVRRHAPARDDRDGARLPAASC